ncbi:MAG TPA: carboxylesterase/lipase family protein [Bradyrhizobium sp.]|nr:carboxylesterase/lipase family protein [Bradyrhizobium sp.]
MDYPVVETPQGKLRGHRESGVVAFKGVRFAAPPFGANRLQPPQPIEAWDGVRDALSYGPKSPQVPYPPGIAEALAELVGPGEDCLTLNIWTPDSRKTGCPVMVWIPGGMFEFHATGATAFYDGSRFARDGVVCVTINYRVGAEGFLYLGDGLANLGLLDQIAALEWVRDNIAAFGGDPRQVTIFGESAGGMSVATLLAMPRAKGLFHRAIVQSGNTPNVTSAATAERIGRRLAEVMGVEPRREVIAALPPERLLEAQAQLRGQLLARPDPALWSEVALSFLPWAPTVDGQIIPQPPVEAIRIGAAQDIDLLVGGNTEETRLFFLSDGSIDRITDQALSALVMAYGLPPQGLSSYRAANPGANAGELLSAIQTDWYWRIPAVRLADAHASSAARASTYMYEFAWRSPQLGGRLGAAHGVEMAFVFDTLGFGTEPMLGREPPQSLATAMHAAWVAFATTGDCGWPKYDPARRMTMHFDTASHVISDPLGAALARWKSAGQLTQPAPGGGEGGMSRRN